MKRLQIASALIIKIKGATKTSLPLYKEGVNRFHTHFTVGLETTTLLKQSGLKPFTKI